MNGISSKAESSLTNKKKYNGIEFDEDLGLNIYEAFYRHLDPHTGRWWEIDPKIDAGYENVTPYNSMFNDPIRYSDFMGDEASDGGRCCGGIFETAKAVTSVVLNAMSDRLYSKINKVENAVFGTNLTTAERQELTSNNLKALPGAIMSDFSNNPFGNIAGVGGLAIKAEIATTEKVLAKGISKISNEIPKEIARVIPASIENPKTLGRVGASEVFVTAATDIKGLNAKDIAKKLTIPESESGFKVITMKTPEGIATPIVSDIPGFVGKGRTAGNAREFVIPNQSIPKNAKIKTIQ